MHSTEERTEYVTSLRALADLIEQHDSLALPFTGTIGAVQWIEVVGSADEQRAAAQTFARVIPGAIAKDVSGEFLTLEGKVGSLPIKFIANREAVCTRVVKEVREITREVPDPDALAAVPTVTVTETVEDVEWVCQPLMADREQVPA